MHGGFEREAVRVVVAVMVISEKRGRGSRRDGSSSSGY